MKRLMKLAQRQHGAFALYQARQLGVADHELRTKRREGVFERGCRGVYVVAGSPKTWRQKLMIAVLAAGPGAAASFRAAAALWHLPGYGEGIIEVTQPRQPSRRYKVAHGHSSRYLPAHHIKVIDGIPVTSIERTVFDLCGRRSLEGAKLLVRAVIGRKKTTFPKLSLVLAETGSWGRPATKVLQAALVQLTDQPMTESELEELVLTVLRRAGLPLPQLQVNVGGIDRPIGRVDFLYGDARFIIEADSRQWHGEWLATVADHRRDKLLMTAGFQIVHTNWYELVNEPEILVNTVRSVLERHAA